MTKLYVGMSDAEAHNLCVGTQSLLVMPCRPEDLRPYRGVVSSRDFPDAGRVVETVPGTFQAYLRKYGGVSLGELVCPYAPGDEIGVKERYATCRCMNEQLCSGYVYSWSLGWNNPPVSGPHRSAKRMPIKAIHTHLLCKSVACRQVQTLTLEECYTLGFTPDALSAALEPMAKKVKRKDMHWIHGHEEGESWCYRCAVRKVRELVKAGADPKEVFVDGGWGGDEDGNESCEGCNVRLDNTLTKYGTQSELEHFRSNDVAGPDDAYCLWNVLECDGNTRLQPGTEWCDIPMATDVAIIAARFFWRKRYPESPWASNPWCWFVTVETKGR